MFVRDKYYKYNGEGHALYVIKWLRHNTDAILTRYSLIQNFDGISAYNWYERHDCLGWENNAR